MTNDEYRLTQIPRFSLFQSDFRIPHSDFLIPQSHFHIATSVFQNIDIPGTVFSFAVLEGNPANMLADYSTEHEVDLIVIASHGRSGVSRWVMGSVAERIVRTSCIPVMMVRVPGCEPKATSS